MALESTLVPFVWPRTAAGCDQGPPSVEPRCSVQIRIRSDSTSGCRSEPYLPAMCTPISAWAPISCDDEDLQNWRCRTAGPRGMNQPEDKRQKPQIITSPNSRDDPLRIQPASCYNSAQTRPAPKAIQTRIEKSRELPPGVKNERGGLPPVLTQGCRGAAYQCQGRVGRSVRALWGTFSGCLMKVTLFRHLKNQFFKLPGILKTRLHVFVVAVLQPRARDGALCGTYVHHI